MAVLALRTMTLVKVRLTARLAARTVVVLAAALGTVTATTVLTATSLAADRPADPLVAPIARLASRPAPAATPPVDVRRPARAQPLLRRVAVKRLPRVPIVRARVLALGDSVMQGARSQLRARMTSVYVDTAVGRQVPEGIDELERLKAAHALGDAVVIHLGDNGRFTPQEFDRIMKILSAVRRVVFVNLKVPRSWESYDNRVLAAGVRRYSNAALMDWHSKWRSCPGTVFARDGFHLTNEGARCYSTYVAAAI